MLQKVLIDNIAKGELKPKEISNDDYVKRFVSTKLIEGCSEATIRNYKLYINKLLEHINKKLTEITAMIYEIFWFSIRALTIAKSRHLIQSEDVYLLYLLGWKMKITY